MRRKGGKRGKLALFMVAREIKTNGPRKVNNVYDSNFVALAALAGHQNRPQSSQQTHEMTVPNELIGCIIGKGGSKIAEIR